MELWPSCIGFRNFAVNEVHVGSIPIGHTVNIFGGDFLWEGSLIVYQVAAGSTPVAIAFNSPHSTTG